MASSSLWFIILLCLIFFVKVDAAARLPDNSNEENIEKQTAIDDLTNIGEWGAWDYDAINTWKEKHGKFKNDFDVMIAAVKKYPRIFPYASETLKNDDAFVKEAMGFTEEPPLEFAGLGQKSIRKIVQAAARRSAIVFQFASPDLKKDRDFVKTVVQQAGWALKHASENLKNDRDVVLAAIKNKGEALEFASDNLKKDRDVVLAAVKKDGSAFDYADDQLKNDVDFVKEAFLIAGGVYGPTGVWDGLNKDMKHEPQIALAHVSISPHHVLSSIEDALKGENSDKYLDVVKVALKLDKTNLLPMVPENILKLPDIQDILNKYQLLQEGNKIVETFIHSSEYKDQYFPIAEKVPLTVASFNLLSNPRSKPEQDLKQHLENHYIDVISLQEVGSPFEIDGYTRQKYSDKDLAIYLKNDSPWTAVANKNIKLLKDTCNTRRPAIAITLRHYDGNDVFFEDITVTNIHLCGGKYDEEVIGTAIKNGEKTLKDIGEMKKEILEAGVTENSQIIIGDTNSDLIDNSDVVPDHMIKTIQAILTPEPEAMADSTIDHFRNTDFLKKLNWDTDSIMYWNNLPQTYLESNGYTHARFETSTSRFGATPDAIFYKQKETIRLQSSGRLDMDMKEYDPENPSNDRMRKKDGTDHDGVYAKFEVSRRNARCRELHAKDDSKMKVLDYLHFNMAKTLFFNKMKEENRPKYRVTKVLFCSNRMLQNSFLRKKNHFREKGWNFTETWNFHGTKSMAAVNAIMESGFQILPNNRGTFQLGPRFYTAPNPEVSFEYSDKGTPLLIVKAIKGKTVFAIDQTPPKYKSYFDHHSDNTWTEKSEFLDDDIPDSVEMINKGIINMNCFRTSEQLLPVYGVYYEKIM